MTSQWKSTLPREEWSAIWERQDCPSWHRTFVSKLLVKNFPLVTDNKKGLKVLVPLCGKTLDLKWLAETGQCVVGVEGIEKAVMDFMEENKFSYDMQEKELVGNGVAKVYQVKEHAIIIYCCDVLLFARDLEGDFDFIWDKASFEAIDLLDRGRYADVMLNVLKKDGNYLLQTAEYDPADNPGKRPYPVSDDIPHEHYGDRCTVVKYDRRQLEPGEPRPVWATEVPNFGEKQFLITLKH